MPVIDVYAPEVLFPAGCERELSVTLMTLALRAEGFPTRRTRSARSLAPSCTGFRRVPSTPPAPTRLAWCGFT